MKCAACNAEMPADATFCPKCGWKLGSAPSTGPTSGHPLQRSGSDEAEEQLWAGGYSGKAMVGSWILGVIVSGGLIALAVLVPPSVLVAIGLLVLLWVLLLGTFLYRKFNIRYELTTQRFIHMTGVLSRRTDRLEVIDIDDVTVQQGMVERMFGVGTIKVVSSDRTHPQLVLIGIDDVKRVADTIDDARRRERRKRGLHIESI
ncbi:MAG: PH domain-containing protein [Pirellulaceae bacterium]